VQLFLSRLSILFLSPLNTYFFIMEHTMTEQALHARSRPGETSGRGEAPPYRSSSLGYLQACLHSRRSQAQLQRNKRYVLCESDTKVRLACAKVLVSTSFLGKLYFTTAPNHLYGDEHSSLRYKILHHSAFTEQRTLH
jgi:hypothetical protein